ncbi:MAG: glycosyltransferase family 4 protein [Chthoniobacteraceae bacterium]
MSRPLRVAFLTTDNREHFRDYAKPKPFFGTAPEAMLHGFAQLREIEVHVISCVRQPVQSPEKLADNVWYHALEVSKIGWMTTGYQGCIRAVRRKLRDVQPDIVHGQGTERDCAIGAVMSGYPNVLTIHGNMAELARLFRARPFTYGWINAWLEEFTLPRTGGVFCNSAYTEELVRPRARRTWRVANPLRPEFFRPSTNPPQDSVPRIVNIGLVCPRKRQLEILDLAGRLHASGIRVVFEFVGGCPDDDYARRFRERLADAEQAGFARWCGELSADELVSQIDRSAALLHFPSEEAFGLVVAEGLARNLKFFGARLGGIVDIASGLDGAELFDSNDWDALAAGISRWVEAGAPKPAGAAGVMETRYHPRVIAQRHLEIYREVLASDS